MTILTYGDHSVDMSKAPVAMTAVLMSRGFNHIMANETASYVSGQIEKALELPEGTTKEARQAAFKQFRLENAGKVNAWEKQARDEAIADIIAGTLGVSTRGPKVDPRDAAIAAISKAEVVAKLKANSIKVPKGDEKVVLGASGSFTLAELVARNTAKYADRIGKEADRRIAEQTRAAKKAAELAASNAGKEVDVDALI